MTNRSLAAVSVLAVAAALAGTSSRAEAQCRPDDIFCAELRIGPAQPPPPPPVVIETPPPPPVIVQPPPPPVVVQPPPQPPVVIVQPAQPPPPPPRVIVVQRQPPPPATVQVQVQRTRRVRTELVPSFDLGVHIDVAGLAMENAGMGGVQGAFRLRPIRHIGIDIGAGLFGGTSSNYGVAEGGRWEVPVLLDVLFFFNPQHRFQVYALLGAGVSVAGQEVRGGNMRQLEYVGGEAGLGFEWRLGRHFALNLDGRGFIRQHVGDDGPEFQRTNADGSVETTDLSGGFYGTIGMTFYFGGH